MPLPEEVRIREVRHVSSWGNPDGDNPDRNVCHVSLVNVCHAPSGGVVPTNTISFFYAFHLEIKNSIDTKYKKQVIVIIIVITRCLGL